MTARQGKLAVALTSLVLTALLARAAIATGNWTGLAVTEVGLLVPMTISWWILTRHRRD